MKVHKEVQQLWEKYKYAVLVSLIGIGLLLWPGQTERSRQTSQPAAFQTQELQREMETILGKIAGVGQVRVMLTTETDGERVLAQDTDLRYSGHVEAPERYERSSGIIMRDGINGDEPVIVQTQYPVYRGALIVCQGGDRAEVQLAVTAAVMSLTGLSSDRVSVAKWQ